jgi:2-polyprenyl-3-methyl-5-hydroxy-6-metoxy-1,4-benzoquinol methylase
MASLRPPPKPLVVEPAGDSFRMAVLDSFSVDGIDQLEPTQKMWAEFMLTSVERGVNVVNLLGGPSRFKGKRVLDVGCAYGGFLVAAHRAGAKETVGIDLEARLLNLARLLLADHEMEAPLDLADITDSTLPDRLGGFDIVLCNDVLEHVQDLEGTARNLVRLLNPGGRLFLEIPNGAAIRYIESDGHYKLPGITLLDHLDAEGWFRAFYEDRYPYQTYFYASLDYYLSLFSRSGIHLRLLNAPPAHHQAVVDLAQQWEEAHQRLLHLGAELPDKPADLIEAIQTRASEIATRFGRLLTTASSSPLAEERDIAASILLTTFGLDSFLLEGRKSERVGR